MASQSQPVATAAPSAASRVFAIFELAEVIFLDVPVKDIIVNLQRTCKQFKEVIKESTPVQQALFLKPYGEPLEGGEAQNYRREVGVHHLAPTKRQIHILNRTHEAGGWLDLSCTQPPIKALEIALKSSLDCTVVTAHEGIRFRDIIAASRDESGQNVFEGIWGYGLLACPPENATAKKVLKFIEIDWIISVSTRRHHSKGGPEVR